MPNWKKVIVSGSNAILNNITSSGDISASGDIYATNFYGNFIGTASIASAVTITELDTAGFFDVLFTNGSNLFATDDTYSDFSYNPSTNTLQVDNIIGTASLADTVEINDYVSGGSIDILLGNNNTIYIQPDSGLTYNFDTDTLNVENLEGTASLATTSSYALTASYVENGVNILGNTNNRVLTATGNNDIQGESGLTFDGQTLSTFKLSLNANNPLTVTTQAGQALTINDDNLNLIKIGDISGGYNETLFSVNDDATKITFYTDGISSEFNSTGLKTTGNITASGNVSASSVLTDTIIFPNTNGKITTPIGQITDDYVTLDGTNRYFEVKLDGDSYFKVDQNNELISLNESTKHGINSNDTHQFTGSVDIKGNTNIDGNLVINGDITAEQYIVNSTVTNVTMSFSSGSTIFGDSLDDTHLFTGSVDITGSLTVDGMTYPTTDGEDGQVLMTDGSGVLTFNDVKVYAQVKNISGTTLAKGTPVHATASVSPPAGNVSEVIAASASLASTMPATFILDEELVNEAEGRAILSGFINGVDTLAFNEGDVVYVGPDGGYTTTKPTGTNLIQNLGIITKVDEFNGAGYIYGSGRSNDVPNIPAGYAWVGNSDGVATAVPTSSFEDNLGNHIATQDLDMAGFSISASLNITASGNISASGDIIGNSLYSDKTINIKGTEYPTSSFYLIETEPGQNFKEGVIHFSGSIDDVSSTVFDIFKISTGSNQILHFDYQVSWYKSDVLWASVGHKSKLIVGSLMTSEGLSDNNPTAADFTVFTTTGNTNYNYTNAVYELDGGSVYTIWSSSFQNEYLQYSLDYGDSILTDNIHENGDEVKINVNYKLIKSI